MRLYRKINSTLSSDYGKQIALQFFERSNEIAETSANEKVCYNELTNESLNWLG
jgi:hypothetical protein